MATLKAGGPRRGCPFFFRLRFHNLCGGGQALEFSVQFIDTLPPLFMFPTVRIGRTTVRFLFYRVDLFLNEFGEFVSDSLRVS
jgi:hypothetical protein